MPERPFDWTARALERLDERQLRRRIVDLQCDGARGTLDGRDVLICCSNDYLGLSRDARVLAAQRSADAAGATGARLLSGSRAELTALERELAVFLGQEAALVFSSGYLAAVGAIPALARGASAVLSDERNHASLIDGIRLSGVAKSVYPAGSLPEGRPGSLLVTEAIYGMDGVAPPLPELAERAHAFGWRTLIDDAHGIGVVGDRGVGSGTAFARRTDGVLLGTLSKALGSLGGFIAGPTTAIEYLVSAARSFIFDTALPPPVVRAARAALELVPHMDAERAHIRALGASLRERLTAAGLDVAGDAEAAPHLLFLIVGSAGGALAVARGLLERGVFAPAIRPPTVPDGASRIRFSLTASHTQNDIDFLAAAIEQTCATLLARRD